MPASISELQPTSAGPHDIDIVVHFEDPGAKAFMEPVLPYLADNPYLHTNIVLGGFSGELENTPSNVGLLPLGEGAIGRIAPALVVSGVSADAGIYNELARRFEGTPTLLAEDYYGASNGYFDRHFQQGCPLPDYFLAIDEVAKQEMIRRNGRSVIDLASRIEVSGHPALDYTVDAAASKRERQRVREHMGLTDHDVLLSCFASINAVGLVKQFAEGLRDRNQNIHIAFKPHPRDIKENKEYYDTLLLGVGLPRHDTGGIDYRSMVIAADAVAVLPHSTVSLHAIELGIPTYHIDTSIPSGENLQVPVRYGKSTFYSPEEFGMHMDELVKKKSKPFEADQKSGDAAQRVALYIGELSSRLSANAA